MDPKRLAKSAVEDCIRNRIEKLAKDEHIVLLYSTPEEHEARLANIEVSSNEESA